MTITALPDAPSRSDTPADFITKADAFVAALAVLVTEMNAAISTVNMTKWITGTTYAVGDVVWSPADFQAYRCKVAGVSSTDPSADSTNWQRTEVSATSLQNQTYSAYLTGGSSTAYTLTPTPAAAALAENQEFDVEFHAAAGATPTLAVSGLTAKLLKYRDAAGAKQAVTSAQIPSGWRSRVVYDGTDYIVREVPQTVLANGTALQVLRMNAGATATEWAHPITIGTQQASTSGTSIDFTSIPATARRITIMFNGVSTNSSATLVIVRIGDSGGLETTSYIGGAGSTASTDGFLVGDSGNLADARTGALTLTLMDAATNTWCCNGTIFASNTPAASSVGGAKALSATLDRLSITTSAGTATFDAGNISISYE